MKYFNRSVVALCAVALAIPAGVMAKGPSGHGNPNHPNHSSKHCNHQSRVGYTYGGTLDPSSTASALVINVTHANHWAKALKGTKVTLDATDSAKAQYNPASPFDANGNPNQGVDLSKYTVQVIGKVGKSRKGCTFDNSAPSVRKVVVNGPDSTDQPEQPEAPQS